MKLPLRFERREGFEDQMRILKRPYGEHEGYARENDGTWIILDADGYGVIRVAFQGEAKRGKGWDAPDPEGMKLARLIVESINGTVKLAAAVLAYDTAIESCANDPAKMASFCSAQGDDLDALYLRMVSAARSAGGT